MEECQFWHSSNFFISKNLEYSLFYYNFEFKIGLYKNYEQRF